MDDSCRRLLRWCGPLLTPEQWELTRSAAAAFVAPGSAAHHRQRVLAERAADTGSWADDFWDVRYLGRRDRIALNANYFFLLPPTGEAQPERAAGLIVAAVAADRAMDAGTWPPPPTETGQSTALHRYLFGTTRIPGVAMDGVRGPERNRADRPAGHVAVLAGGRVYRLAVVGSHGAPHPPAALADALTEIRADAAARPAEHPVGHLTSDARPVWACARQALLSADPANARAVDDIETALCCVALDDQVPGDDQHAADALLHGDSANRWFDKSLTFVVFADGTAGLTCEHCRLDGTVVVDLVDRIAANTARWHAAAAGARSQGTPEWEPLAFVLDADLRAGIERAAAGFRAAAATTSTRAVEIPGIGAELIKSLRMSPDAFCQMAFQLADRRSRTRLGSTYESIAMRGYVRGRTEAMRVVTPEIVDLRRTADAAGRDELAAAVRAAADAHVRRAQRCRAGAAPEQHLWQLQMLLHPRGRATDATGTTEVDTGQFRLFDTPGWHLLRDDHLSTSALASRHIRYFGFGATGRHCIGIGYTIDADALRLNLSAGEASDALPAFADALADTLTEMVALLRPGSSGRPVAEPTEQTR